MAFEDEVRRIGQEIFAMCRGQTPSIFDKGWWSGKMMDWSMRDPAFKVEMFRFIDVFPALHDSETVARHLQEFFCRPEQDFPASLQWGLRAVSPGSAAARAVSAAVRKNVIQMAARFIAGATPEAAMGALRELWEGGVAHTVDLLGEATVSADEAHACQTRYVDLIERLGQEVRTWRNQPRLEADARGPLPRANVSVKVSALAEHLDPLDTDGGVGALKDALRPLFLRAARDGAFLNVDLEQHRLREITYRVFRELLMEPPLGDYPHFGIVVQAYLRDAEEDARALVRFCRKERRAPITVRLVKGAYWDYETVLAAQNGWPPPVFVEKADSDASFERLTELFADAWPDVKLAVASHNVRTLAHAIAYARKRRLPADALEYQTLFGMAEPIRQALRNMGLRVRAYVPVGELVPGMAYLVRRLLENTSNESFLRHTFVDEVDAHMLLQPPEPATPRRALGPPPVARPPRTLAEGNTGPRAFANEPPADFTRPEEREALRRAIATRLAALETGPPRLPLRIGGREVWTGRWLRPVDPGQPSRVVGEVACADAEEASQAVAAAAAAAPAWQDTPVEQRSQILFDAAEHLRRRRHELAALAIVECAKPWRDADADVCEAIDFLEYYGRELLRVWPTRRLGDHPGELNHYGYLGRGVTAVIAPWNFPLAIPAGMVAAALAAGNPVILKPAEQSPVIAAELVRALLEAGLPPGCIAYLPGRGEEVGAALVDDPRVACIAFTGSRDVGLAINEAAARVRPGQRLVKRVIAEMGGKNAVIVDDDADLDEAVLGVVSSAFGYSGQKCSACSRVIVLPGAYDAFVGRLVAAARSLRIGPATDPATRVGPVIDADAVARIRGYVEVGRDEGEALLVRDEPPGREGHYVPLAVFGGIERQHRLAREEIFGPVLAVLHARTIEEAIEIALDSDYALTGGLYSRSPGHIALCREHFRVGNLYVNRGITGALVGRQPFGGAALSGVGSKAGGPDYLLQFAEPVTVTENTLRRGFAGDAAAP